MCIDLSYNIISARRDEIIKKNQISCRKIRHKQYGLRNSELIEQKVQNNFENQDLREGKQ